jgi:hypothetical protein
VEEGLFVSDEPAEVLDQQLELPNQDGALSEDVERALIEKLAEQLGIDPQYISLNGLVDGASRQRVLSGGLTLKIMILSDDSGALAAALEALTSDPSFWQGVNERLVENNATTTLDTSDIVVQAAVPACNENFNYDNATETCVAVPISCGIGTFAAVGTGQCVDCPAGKYSDEAGASVCKSCAPGSFGAISGPSSCVNCVLGNYQPLQGQLACDVCPSGKFSRKEGLSICERCMPGQYSHSSAYRCKSCPSGYYQQSDSGNEGLTSTCQHCPWGKFQNLNGSVYCEEVWSNHLLVMVPTNKFEQRQCPRIGVSCENNSKRYTG